MISAILKELNPTAADKRGPTLLSGVSKFIPAVVLYSYFQLNLDGRDGEHPANSAPFHTHIPLFRWVSP